MATFNIYLGDPHGLDIDWWELEDAVWWYFNKSVAAKETDAYDRVVVKKVTTAPALLPEDLLVYVVGTHERGVLSQRFGPIAHTDNQYGQTKWEGNLFGAEVYARDKRTDPWWMAAFIWHEVLHVKTKEEHGMHKRGGLAASPLTESSRITDANVESMRKRLAKQRPMWTGGFAS